MGSIKLSAGGQTWVITGSGNELQVILSAFSIRAEVLFLFGQTSRNRGEQDCATGKQGETEFFRQTFRAVFCILYSWGTSAATSPHDLFS